MRQPEREGRPAIQNELRRDRDQVRPEQALLHGQRVQAGRRIRSWERPGGQGRRKNQVQKRSEGMDTLLRFAGRGGAA